MKRKGVKSTMEELSKGLEDFLNSPQPERPVRELGIASAIRSLDSIRDSDGAATTSEPAEENGSATK